MSDNPIDMLEREGGRYLKTAEVARILHVSPKTIARWAKERKLPFVKTLGGHRRFPADQIEAIAAQMTGTHE